MIATAMGDAWGGTGPGSYARPSNTIAMRDMPTNIKQVFRLTRFYKETDSLLSALTDKMSEYPVTEIVIDSIADEQLSQVERDKWEELLDIVINLRQTMMDINTDKFVYGNSFHFMYYPFVRFCVDPDDPTKRYPITRCEVRTVHPVDGPGGWTFHVDAMNPETKKVQRFHIEDRKADTRRGFRLLRLSPLRMTLRYNPASGEREWSWTPHTRLKNDFLMNDPTVLNTTEMRTLEAAYKDRKIKMNPNRLWVAQAPGSPDLWEGWGVPPLFRVLEDVYYYKILRRANEALAQEHVTPLRFLSPRGTGDVSPQRTVNLSDWQARLKQELVKFKQDPNHIVLSPLPVEVEQMGGNARVMMVATEMESAARAIACGVGCPIEFLWGGLTWSGGNVALRVLENHFINMRQDNERLLDFMMPKLASYFNLPRVKLSLSDFKMADDVQQQSNSINLMLQGFLAREDVLPDLGRDPDQTFDRLEAEHERMNRITMKDNVAAAHMQTVIQRLEALASIMLQAELQIAQANISAQSERERLRQLQAHVNELHAAGKTSPLEFDQSASLLARMDPGMSQAILTQWGQTMPNVTQLLVAAMAHKQQSAAVTQQAMQTSGAASAGAAAADPGAAGAPGPYSGGATPQAPELIQPQQALPEQKPPRRQQGSI